MKAFIPLRGSLGEQVDPASFDVEIRTRDGVLTQSHPAALAAAAPLGGRLFRLEVR